MRFLIPIAFLLVTSSILRAEQTEETSAAKANADIPGWGKPVDPDGDCKFFAAAGELLITVPGSNGPHDLAAEIHTINAPRVLQPVRGDFSVQVKVEGRLAPGDESTLPGRTGYNGAGLVLMADPQNVICLARAVLHRSGGDPMGYANFEMRSEGKLDRMGDSNECPLPQTGPVFLRLERRGQKILGAVSSDGEKWDALEPKGVPANWPKQLQLGVVAISTSTEEFNPRFSELKRPVEPASGTEPGVAAARPGRDIYTPWSAVGDWKVTNPEWTDVLTLKADGTYSTGRGSTGRWTLAADAGTPLLVIRWDLYGTDSLAMITPSHFRGQKGTGRVLDMRRGEERSETQAPSQATEPTQ